MTTEIKVTMSRWAIVHMESTRPEVLAIICGQPNAKAAWDDFLKGGSPPFNERNYWKRLGFVAKRFIVEASLA